MKLEVGMYVRTKNGIIDRVIIDYKGKCNSPNCNCKHVSCQYNYYDEVDIINASHNIIDLIEVGDYVNGSKVIDISIIGKDKEKWVWVEQMEDSNNKYGDDYVGYNNDQIKSIVTKEQFESMSYKVVEE